MTEYDEKLVRQLMEVLDQINGSIHRIANAQETIMDVMLQTNHDRKEGEAKNNAYCEYERPQNAGNTMVPKK